MAGKEVWYSVPIQRTETCHVRKKAASAASAQKMALEAVQERPEAFTFFTDEDTLTAGKAKPVVEWNPEK